MLVLQNSPQRQVSSLYGQSIRPHAWPLASLIVQPCSSACRIAASISGFGCLLRAMGVVDYVKKCSDSRLVVK